MIDRIAADLQTRRTFEILSLRCEYVDEFRSELKRHTQRCHELMVKFARLYQRARETGTMRADVAPETAALGTCVFVTGMLRLWLMDERGVLLRPQVDALIASHIALLRTKGRRVSRRR